MYLDDFDAFDDYTKIVSLSDACQKWSFKTVSKKER